MDQLIEENLTCLDQGIELLEVLPQELYTKACAFCFGSTIGGHLRHNIDHYQQFLEGFEARRVNYDARTRQIEVETLIPASIRAMHSLKAGLSALRLPEGNRGELEVLMDGGVESQWTRSSVTRELQFLISHTIHHYALVVTIAKVEGFNKIPADFGVAPSTLKYRKQRSA